MAEPKQIQKEKSHNPFFRVPPAVQVTMLVALVIGFIFISPYLGAVMFSALIALVFNPIYKKLLKLTRNTGVAVTGTLIAVVLSIMIPLIFIIGVTINQATTLVSQFSNGSANLGPAQIETVLDRGVDRANEIIKGFPGGESVNIDKGSVTDALKKAGKEAAQFLVNFLKTAGGAAIGFISTVILSFFLIIGMLVHQDKLIGFLRKLSPFDDSINNMYLARASTMTKAMVKGQLLIAIAQGFASALSLWIVGVDYFWFFFVILSFLSFIPLGGGILTLPIGIIIMATGHLAQGIFVILFHFIVVSNIDNLLRPKLVPKHVSLNSALVILSVFSGIALFGAAGVIYGPVLMILLVTTFEMYAKYNEKAPKISLPE